jgi:hypothetical protein
MSELAEAVKWDSEQQARTVAAHISLSEKDMRFLQGYLHRAFVAGQAAAVERGRREGRLNIPDYLAQEIWDNWCGPGTKGMPSHMEAVEQIIRWLAAQPAPE